MLSEATRTDQKLCQTSRPGGSDCPGIPLLIVCKDFALLKCHLSNCWVSNAIELKISEIVQKSMIIQGHKLINAIVYYYKIPGFAVRKALSAEQEKAGPTESVCSGQKMSFSSGCSQLGPPLWP